MVGKWASGKYITTMLFAAMIALIRGFVVAGILDVASFGLYATVLATGMFLSTLVSFGEVERTVKSFPRLWMVETLRRSVVERADRSAMRMLIRSVAVLLLLLVCSLIDVLNYFSEMAMLAVLIALNAALSSLYASAIRATGEVSLLARNTFIRAVIVILFGLSGAYLFGWKGAIVGEVAAAFLGALITRYSVVQQSPRVKVHASFAESLANKASENLLIDNGFWLFWAGLLASAPIYLDRAFVASALGSEMVGTFGFLMLFVTSANAFTGIIIQKIGPQLIKMQHAGDALGLQVRFAIRWLFLIWGVYVMGMVLASLLLFFKPALYFVDKFALNIDLMGATAALSLLQVGVVLEYILISRNQERAIFLTACGYLICAGVVAFFVFLANAPLSDLLWLLVVAKGIHVAAQVGLIGGLLCKKCSSAGKLM